MNLFNKITKGNEDKLLFEGEVIGTDGRLTTEGAKTFLDLMFLGMTAKEAREKILAEIEKEQQEA
jgi:hypothetical protein